LDALSELRIEKESALKAEKSITTRIRQFGKHFENDIEMTEFDRDILESLVEKVVIGVSDEEGNPRPYVFTFVFYLNGARYRQ
jgi:hypothetical protein